MPRSQVREALTWSGSSRTCRIIAPTTLSVSLPSTWTSRTNRDGHHRTGTPAPPVAAQAAGRHHGVPSAPELPGPERWRTLTDRDGVDAAVAGSCRGHGRRGVVTTADLRVARRPASWAFLGRGRRGQQPGCPEVCPVTRLLPPMTAAVPGSSLRSPVRPCRSPHGQRPGRCGRWSRSGRSRPDAVVQTARRGVAGH